MARRGLARRRWRKTSRDRTGKCYVIVDNYEGRERNKVDDYLDSAAINNSHTSQHAVKPQKPASPPIDDDDIPVD